MRFAAIRRCAIRYEQRQEDRLGREINGAIVKGLVIALPPLDEQREIVRLIDGLLASGNSVLRRIDATSGDLSRSALAILAKAVRGELTPSVGQLNVRQNAGD